MMFDNIYPIKITICPTNNNHSNNSHLNLVKFMLFLIIIHLLYYKISNVL